MESASAGAFASDPEATRLFAEGVGSLRVFDALGARDLLEKAVPADPSFALAHSGLADAWGALGYLAKSNHEAKKAFDASGTLPREESLLVEGRYREAAGVRLRRLISTGPCSTFFRTILTMGYVFQRSNAGRPGKMA